MAQPCQRLCAQGQAEHRHHRHFIHSLAEIFYQRRKLQRESFAVANADTCHIFAQCTGHRMDRPIDASPSATAKHEPALTNARFIGAMTGQPWTSSRSAFVVDPLKRLSIQPNRPVFAGLAHSCGHQTLGLKL